MARLACVTLVLLCLQSCVSWRRYDLHGDCPHGKRPGDRWIENGCERCRCDKGKYRCRTQPCFLFDILEDNNNRPTNNVIFNKPKNWSRSGITRTGGRWRSQGSSQTAQWGNHGDSGDGNSSSSGTSRRDNWQSMINDREGNWLINGQKVDWQSKGTNRAVKWQRTGSKKTVEWHGSGFSQPGEFHNYNGKSNFSSSHLTSSSNTSSMGSSSISHSSIFSSSSSSLSREGRDFFNRLGVNVGSQSQNLNSTRNNNTSNSDALNAEGSKDNLNPEGNIHGLDLEINNNNFASESYVDDLNTANTTHNFMQGNNDHKPNEESETQNTVDETKSPHFNNTTDDKRK